MDFGSWSLIGNWRCIKTNQKNKLNWPSESLIIMLVVITQCILYTIHSFGSILLLHSWCDTCLFLVYIKHSETTWSEPSDAVKFHNNIDVFLHRSHKSCARTHGERDTSNTNATGESMAFISDLSSHVRERLCQRRPMFQWSSGSIRKQVRLQSI